jgi:hypothetical protein
MRRLRFPVVYLDFNDRIDTQRYFLCSGSYDSIRKLGLALDEAVGKHFTFWMDEGTPEDVICEGVLAFDPKWKYVADIDVQIGYFQRSQVDLGGDET